MKLSRKILLCLFSFSHVPFFPFFFLMFFLFFLFVFFLLSEVEETEESEDRSEEHDSELDLEDPEKSARDADALRDGSSLLMLLVLVFLDAAL